jgi:hypothetical protein
MSSTGGAGEPAGASANGYSDVAREADLKRGYEDGKRGAPSYSHLSPFLDKRKCFGTPYSEELWALASKLIQAEFKAYEGLVSPKKERIKSLFEELEAAKKGVEHGVLELERASALLTPDEILPRNPQEVKQTPEIRRARRVLERDKRIREERERQAGRVAKVNSIKQSIAETYESMDRDFVLAKEQAKTLARAFEARIAAYWGGVAATHPEGQQLGLLTPYICRPLPAWLSATSEKGVLAPAVDEGEPEDSEPLTDD